jgi:hypothetical protein
LLVDPDDLGGHGWHSEKKRHCNRAIIRTLSGLSFGG